MRRLRPVLSARQAQAHPLRGTQTDRSAVDVVAKSFDLDVDQPVVDAVQRVAESRGIPMSKVALALLLAKPVVSAPYLSYRQIGQKYSKTENNVQQFA